MSFMLKNRPTVRARSARLASAVAEQIQVLEKRVLFSTFAAGDLAVVVAAASAINTTASVVEVSPTSTTPTTPVQTIAVPGTGANAIRVSGSATSTLYVADSSDRKYLVFTGANSTDNTSNTNALLTRAVVAVDSSGTISLPTTYTGANGNQPRGASSPDDATWYIGDQGGLYTNGSTTPSPTGNFRSVKSFGGIVYGLTASTSSPPVDTFSAPSGGTATALPGLPNGTSNIQDFYLLSSGINGTAFDELYVLSATSGTAGTIAKYSLVSGTWTANGAYTTTIGGFGLAAAKDPTAGTDLYVTTGTGATTNNGLVKFVDTAGYNATISIITANKVTLYNAPTGAIVKGVAFAPVLLAPTITSVSPPAGSTGGGTVVTVNGANFTTTSTVSLDGGATSLPITFVSSAQLTFTTPAHSAGSVNVTVTNATGTSAGTTFTFGSSQTAIGSFTVAPSPAGIGQAVNFNASSVSAPAGDTVASVSFYSETTPGTVGSSDPLLGTVTGGSGGVYALNYTPNNPGTGDAALAAGNYDIYAVANSAGGSLSPASTAQPLTVTVPQVAFNASTLVFASTAGAQTIPVIRSGDLADGVTVNYTISDGTAINGTNYTAPATGSLTFLPGSATPSTPLSVTLDNSSAQIGTLNFSLALTSASPSNLNTVLGSAVTVYVQQSPRAFTAGDVAVYQVGDGSTALTANGNQVYIAEYNSSGGLVQDFPLPTYAAGTANSEGALSLSADGHKLIVPGYVSTSPTGVAASSVNRDVDIVSSTGSIDSSTVIPGADFSNNNIRSATSDNGTGIWIGTAANGLRYTTDGSTASSKLISSTATNVRNVEAIGGQLYESLGTGSTRGVATVGTGLPTTGSQTAVNLPGVVSSTSSPYAYALVHLNGPGSSPDTLYLTDDSLGIQKYSLVSGTWTLEGTIGAGSNGFRGITASVNAGVVTLYATSSTGLYLITDTAGYNAAPSSGPSSPLVTAGTNIAFRGVAFAPVPVATPSIASLDNTTGFTGGGTAVTITGANFTPYSTVSFGSQAAAVTYVSPTQLLATSPLVYSGGAVNISVTTVDGTSNTLPFTYTQPAWLSATSSASYNPGTHVLLVNGTANIISDPGSDSPLITVTAGNLIINPATTPIHVGSLALVSGSTTSLPATTASPVILVIAAGNGGLSIDSTSKLDLGNGYLDLLNNSQSDAMTALQAITQSVGIGYNNGNWNGLGIDSSTAAGDTTHLTALGVIENSMDGGTTALYSATAGSLGKFDGIYPAATDVLVRFTWMGDANLTGNTDGSDYSRIDAAYGSSATGWFNGDFNYDKAIDGSDYTLLDNAYNTQGSAFTSAQIASPAAMIAGGRTGTAAPCQTFTGAVSTAFSNKKVKTLLVDQVLQDLAAVK